MQRSFCVIVLQTCFAPDGKEYSKYDNYRVLSGSQDEIDFLETKFKEFDPKEFTFEVQNQV